MNIHVNQELRYEHVLVSYIASFPMFFFSLDLYRICCFKFQYVCLVWSYLDPVGGFGDKVVGSLILASSND